MKKILLALIIPLILLVHYGYYVSTEREFKIAQRAFTIGSWDACKEGPTILERYMSNLAYYHLRFTGAGEQYVSDGGSLVYVALGVSKCGYGTSGYNLDNERVKRGIELGLKYGEDINKVYTNGLRPLHTATTINNPGLI